MKKRGRLRTLYAMALLLNYLAASLPVEAVGKTSGPDQPRPLESPSCQITSGPHVLGFSQGGMYIAASDHMLHVEFADARPVFPQCRNAENSLSHQPGRSGKDSRVSYTGLWKGISAFFEVDVAGNPKSTYLLEAGAGVEQIQLRYSRPARIDASGNLVIAFPSGELRESAPTAWQDIDGRRVAVSAGFRLKGQHVAGFTLKNYDSGYPVTIDPAVSWHTFLGSTGDDQGRAMAVDSSGNVYVLGDGVADWTIPSAIRAYSGGSDAFLVKLSPSGSYLWHMFLGSAQDDFGNAMAIAQNGYLYVAGGSAGNWGSPARPYSGWSDAFVAKIDGNGTILWNTFLGSAESDSATAVSLDSSGNVYVAGTSAGSWGSPPAPYSGGFDAFVAKLDSAGGLVWNAFLGGIDNDSMGSSMGLDGLGNIYVSGTSQSGWGLPLSQFEAGVSHAFVAKLSNLGVRQWHTFLGASQTDVSSGLVADVAGNVFVTGYSIGTWGSPLDPFAGDYDGFLARLSTDGTLIWSTFVGSLNFDSVSAIAWDAFKGAILLAGKGRSSWGLPLNAHSGGNSDVMAARYDLNGRRIWNTFLGSANTEEALGLFIDPLQNVYLTGSSYTQWSTLPDPPMNGHTAGLNKDVFVARIPRIQANLTWNTFMGSPDDFETAYAAAVDNAGNTFVAGRSGSTWGSPSRPFGGGSSDGFLAKLNASGIRIWHAFIGGSGADYANAAVLDGSGNVYVAGTSTAGWGASPANPYAGGTDVFVACLNSNGQLIWNTFLGSSSDDDTYSLAILGSGNLYVAGSSNSSWGGPVVPHNGAADVFLACLNSSNGQRLWNTFAGSAGSDYGYGVAVNPSGTVYVTGYSNAGWGGPLNPFSGGKDAFLAAFNAGNGQRLWNTFLGSAGDDQGSSVAVDSSGDIVVAGSSSGSWVTNPIRAFSGEQDAFVARLAANGALKWNTFLGSLAGDTGSSVVVGPAGSIHVAGYSSASWGAPLRDIAGLQDGFVARLHPNGTMLWNLFFGSSGDDNAFAMAIDSSGNLYVPGFSNGSWGNPVNAFGGIRDAMAVRIFQEIPSTSYLPLVQRN